MMSRFRNSPCANMRTHTAIATLLCSLPLAAPALEEVPFVTTPDNVTLAMLKLADVNRKDYVIDLGSGDGRIVIVAAQKFGARGLGVEIVPELVQRSRVNAKAAGVESRVEFREQDLFQADLKKASVVTLYLLPDVNLKLRPKLLALKPGTRVVSHDWDMGDWQPDKTIALDVPEKTVGFEKKSHVHLWIVPANIGGLWCGAGDARGTTLDIKQAFQHVQGALADGAGTQSFVAQIEGEVVRGGRLSDGAIELRLHHKRLVMSRAGNLLSSGRATAFVRPKKGGC
jgi:SAM-dependent methyltransferase